ncbi:RNase LS family HEPN domain-containing protein [Caballeronia sp. GAWG2-1]|uniref:RNase LS family HEPN domain-containing protein n=1 Tax=Caballeronia sp. GAWG2-1 TaxID=2921744 RepID=UPI00202905FB|nr:RNase LS family HEPN domain-containing protein [Caballeronia sp. GAWG2-1]
MPPKSLNLNQESIQSAVYEFALECGGKATGPTAKAKFDEYELHIDGQKSALLHVYKKNDGSTTLMSKVGTNQELSERLAEHIAKSTTRVSVANKPLTLRNLSKETWEFLREYLEENACKVTDEPLPHGVRIRVVGPERDQVFLHRYDSGGFMMQGRPMAVYAMVMSTLCEVHEDKREVLEAQLEVVQVQTTVDGLYEELHQHLPTAAKYLGDTGCAIVVPAFALTKIAVELPDYSTVAYPALRGLEFYMKQLLVDNEQPVSAVQGLGAHFNKQGSLLSGCAAKFACPPTVLALEKSCALHNLHRNGLFHADGAVPAMTRIIDGKQDATNIVFVVFRTIESTYAAIPQKT